jgi:type II secretory pathway component PulJ
MSKDNINDLASKATAGSNVALVAIAVLAWQTMQRMETKLDAHMAQTKQLIETLERRVDAIEKRVGVQAMPRLY